MWSTDIPQTNLVAPAKAGGAASLLDGAMIKGGWVYMTSDRYRGGIYTGVTAHLQRRIWQHREGIGSQFVRQYGFTRLVYGEQYDQIEDAIRREKAIKKWRREWKIRLIETMNPDWEDMFERLGDVV